MPDLQTRHRFHTAAEPISAADLALKLGLACVGDGQVMVEDVASLERAQAGQLCFFANPKFADALATLQGAAVVLPEAAVGMLPPGCAGLVSAQPQVDFARALERLYPFAGQTQWPEARTHVHMTAQVDPTAHLAPGVVIGAGARIEAHVHLGPGVVIGQGVVVGQGCKIGAQASILCATLGEGCIIHPGVRIGQDGFGFTFDGKQIVKVPQLGMVRIGDEVEIGANTTIDRGAIDDTIVGTGTKIDNLVQIAHNVHIGNMCQISGQVGIAGSTHIGSRVIIGGQAAINGHIEIADGVQIAGRSGVTKSISQKGEVVGGMPAQPIRDWRRKEAALMRLAKRKAKEGDAA